MPVRDRLKSWLRRGTGESSAALHEEPTNVIATQAISEQSAQPTPQASTPQVETATAQEQAASQAVAPAQPNDSTRSFGDTTRSLASRAPQLVALLGERMSGAAALRDIGRTREENQDHCFAQ